MSINRAALPCLGLSFPASSFKDTETVFSSLPCPPEVATSNFYGSCNQTRISLKNTCKHENNLESLRRIIHSYLELSGDIQRPFVIITSMFLWVELAEILKGTK